MQRCTAEGGGRQTRLGNLLRSARALGYWPFRSSIWASRKAVSARARSSLRRLCSCSSASVQAGSGGSGRFVTSCGNVLKMAHSQGRCRYGCFVSGSQPAINRGLGLTGPRADATRILRSRPGHQFVGLLVSDVCIPLARARLELCAIICAEGRRRP
jgi:hypothetical protein